MSLTRIHTGYSKLKTTKVLGCSTLLNKHRVPKSDPACQIYSATELLRVTVSEALELSLFERDDIDIDAENIIYLLRWLEENAILLGAYIFNKGNTDRYHLPATLLSFLRSRKAFYEKEFYTLTGKKGVNFPINTDNNLRVLEKLRIILRQLESDYITWLTDSRIILDLLTNFEEPINTLIYEEKFNLEECDKDSLNTVLSRVASMIRTEHILNDLSNYIWWYCQYAWVKVYGQNNMREWQNEHNPVFEPPKVS